MGARLPEGIICFSKHILRRFHSMYKERRRKRCLSSSTYKYCITSYLVHCSASYVRSITLASHIVSRSSTRVVPLQRWYVYYSGETPALKRQPSLFWILPPLIVRVPVCAERFRKHYSGQLALLNRHYRGNLHRVSHLNVTPTPGQ